MFISFREREGVTHGSHPLFLCPNGSEGWGLKSEILGDRLPRENYK